MSKLTSAMIKEAAQAAGADLVGIGPMSRFEGAPKDMYPRYLFPEAKSVIGFAFRIPRGVQRGIEEGTHWHNYTFYSYNKQESSDARPGQRARSIKGQRP